MWCFREDNMYCELCEKSISPWKIRLVLKLLQDSHFFLLHQIRSFFPQTSTWWNSWLAFWWGPSVVRVTGRFLCALRRLTLLNAFQIENIFSFEAYLNFVILLLSSINVWFLYRKQYSVLPVDPKSFFFCLEC